eukprot:gene9005-12147_t
MYTIIGISHPEDMVNLLAGTFSDGDRFSTGNTLPLVGRPWGFNHWSPQTRSSDRNTGSWWFKGNDHQFTWIRCTHQPSPWIGDWGWFVFSPQIGEVNRNPVHYWEPRAAIIRAHLFDATLAPYGMRIQLVPTMHAAFVRITFPINDYGAKRVCFAEAQWKADGKNFISGDTTRVSIDRLMVTNFAMHIYIESSDAINVEHHMDMACFRYAKDATIVQIKIATSLISQEQAQYNLKTELGSSKTYDQVAKETRTVWNKLLRRVDVVDAGEVSEASNRHLIVFYTSLARALSFPRRLDEINPAGQVVHYSPYDPHGHVFPGVLVTDNGFWDTFRTVYPMLSLLYPDHLGTIIQGWLNAFKEGGWLPSWASPGYRNCMVGTFADVVVADAVVKRVKGFDLRQAKEALMKDSFEDPPRFAGGAVGKQDLQEYNNRGYLSSDRNGDSVSRTLDYGFADYSTAMALLSMVSAVDNSENNNLNKEMKEELINKAEKLLIRANRAYTSLFHGRTGLMLPKRENGEFSNDFSDIEWGKGYTEGNAWHHSFPPYAITHEYSSSKILINQYIKSNILNEKDLIGLFGSKQNMLKKLYQLLALPSNFRPGSYGQEIHEMTEMRVVAMGQYGHNNQPSHHILYLFALLGDSKTTEFMTRKVMNHAYGIDFYAGDEDNGEMGAWFVLSALGLYSITPGTRDYVVGSPIFKHVRISRDERDYDLNNIDDIDNNIPHRSLDIIAIGTTPSNYHVEQITINGTIIKTLPLIDDELLQRSGVLRFHMEGEDSTVYDNAGININNINDLQKMPEVNMNNYLIAIKKNRELNSTLISMRLALLDSLDSMKVKNNDNKNNNQKEIGHNGRNCTRPDVRALYTDTNIEKEEDDWEDPGIFMGKRKNDRFFSDEVLLDNAAAVSIFHNSSLLQNIHKNNDNPTIVMNGINKDGESINLSSSRHFGYFGEVYRTFWLFWRSVPEREILSKYLILLSHDQSGVQHQINSRKRLFYFTKKQPALRYSSSLGNNSRERLKDITRDVSPIGGDLGYIQGNINSYTKREVKAASDAMDLIANLGHP